MSGESPPERLVQRLASGGSRLGVALLVLLMMLPLILLPAAVLVLLIWVL